MELADAWKEVEFLAAWVVDHIEVPAGGYGFADSPRICVPIRAKDPAEFIGLRWQDTREEIDINRRTRNTARR